MSTQYKSTMYIKNSWSSSLTQAWFQHSTDGSGEQALAVTNLATGATSLGTPIQYYSGVHDYWTLTFVDSTGRVYGSDFRVKDAMPNNNVSSVIVTADQNGSKMTISIDGQGSQSFPLYQRA